MGFFEGSVFVWGLERDFFVDLLVFADGIQTVCELGEGDFEGSIGDFGGGFVDGFDEIIGVAGRGDEAPGDGTDILGGGFGSTTTVDVGGVDESAGFEILYAFDINVF